MNIQLSAANEIQPSRRSQTNPKNDLSHAHGTLTRIAARVLSFMAVCFLVGCGVIAQAQSAVRQDLEPILKTYLVGCSTRDFQKIRSAMADVCLATMRNDMVSLKKPFPPTSSEELLAWDGIVASFFSFEKLTFVALKENGQRAILTYRYPKMSEDSNGAQDGFVTADFVHQKDGWKLFKVGGAVESDLNAKFNAGDLSFLDGPKFTPPSEIPPVPPAATPADYIAQCQWYIPTGKLIVTVNGVPHEMNAMTGFHLILGGLKKGENKIKLHFDPAPKTSANVGLGEAKLRIKVFTGDDLRHGTDRQLLVYKWKSEGGDHEETVQMNDEILAKLPNPEMNY